MLTPPAALTVALPPAVAVTPAAGAARTTAPPPMLIVTAAGSMYVIPAAIIGFMALLQSTPPIMSAPHSLIASARDVPASEATVTAVVTTAARAAKPINPGQ